MATNWRVLPISITVNNRQSFCFVTQLRSRSAQGAHIQRNHVKIMYDKHQFVVYFVHTNDIRIKFPVRETVETELHILILFLFRKRTWDTHTHLRTCWLAGETSRFTYLPLPFAWLNPYLGTVYISFHCMHQHFGSLVRCDPSSVNNNFN